MLKATEGTYADIKPQMSFFMTANPECIQFIFNGKGNYLKDFQKYMDSNHIKSAAFMLSDDVVNAKNPIIAYSFAIVTASGRGTIVALESSADLYRQMKYNNQDIYNHLFTMTLKWLQPRVDKDYPVLLNVVNENMVRFAKNKGFRPTCKIMEI
jgi:hypothetical protein